MGQYELFFILPALVDRAHTKNYFKVNLSNWKVCFKKNPKGTTPQRTPAQMIGTAWPKIW